MRRRLRGGEDDAAQPGPGGVRGGRGTVVAGGGDDDAGRAAGEGRADRAAVETVLVAPRRIARLVLDQHPVAQVDQRGAALAQPRRRERRQQRCPAVQAVPGGGGVGGAEQALRDAVVGVVDLDGVGDAVRARARATLRQRRPQGVADGRVTERTLADGQGVRCHESEGSGPGPGAHLARHVECGFCARPFPPTPEVTVMDDDASAPVAVVGIGADGWAGLTAASREALTGAAVVVGGPRQLELLPPRSPPSGSPGRRRCGRPCRG